MSGNEGSTSQTDSEKDVNFYLLKAEPDTRIVKGKDVKFSVDDFETVKTSPWEGVRNFEARNIMKEMKVGDKALFYHSNCKTPGIAAFAEVSKEAYPDFTAWDPDHPYYDPKTDEKSPKWFMVDLTFVFRAKHPVPLALLRYISTVSPPSSKTGEDVPDLIEEIAYLERKGVSAIQGMGLVTRGRLSVQRVKQEEWNAINLLAERGGWEALDLKKLGMPSKSKAKAKPKATLKTKSKKPVAVQENVSESDESEPEQPAKKPSKARGKRHLESNDEELEDDRGTKKPAQDPQTRRSSRRMASQTSGDHGETKRKRRKIK